MDLSAFLLEANSSVKGAMQQINKNTKGIVYIIKNEILSGVITDGDIRRFLLEGGDINSNISLIINTSPIILNLSEEKKAYQLMEDKKIRSLPIVDFENKIIKIYFNDDKVAEKKEKLNIPVVIMAGGKGTRLYPYTQILPKPLIPIGDKTITEHIMDRFIEYGCNSFTMIINYKKNFIKSYFEDNENSRKIYFEEEKEFLGTGGGLKLLHNKIRSTFFMTNCDVLIEEDYSRVLKYHKEQKNIVTMVCAVKKMIIPYGTVEVSNNDEILSFKEKPEFSFITNTGLYILEPEFIDMIPSNSFIHITDIIQKCIEEKKRVGIYKISEDKWLDMGQMEELEKMKKKLNV